MKWQHRKAFFIASINKTNMRGMTIIASLGPKFKFDNNYSRELID